MVHLYRLIVSVVILLFSFHASAVIDPVTRSPYSIQTYTGNTPSAACASYAASPPPWSNVYVVGLPDTGANALYCHGTQTTGGHGVQQIVGGGALTCPPNSAVSGRMCSCSSGYSENAASPGACFPVCTPPKVQSIGIGGVFQGCLYPADSLEAKCEKAKGSLENYYSTPSPAKTNTVCASLGGNAGCAITLTYTASATANGVKTLYGTGVVSGKSCAEATASNASSVPPLLPPVQSDAEGAPAPTPCKPGTLPGQVNGVTVCMPSGSSTTPVDQTSTTKTTNPDGSTTTKASTTSCDGANCTTTTTATTVPASGGSGTTTTEKQEKPKDTFCQENPTSSICKTGSFSGSCTSGFTCDGDALQCSIAREQYARNCQMFDKALPESALYDTEKLKTGNQTTALPGNGSVTLSSSSFDQTAVFASQGLTDIHVTVAGKDNTIELSRLNSWLEVLGFIGVAVTSLVCFRVVFGGAA